MMTSDYVDLAATHDHSAANGDIDYGLMLSDPAANDPMAFCRSQATAGVALLTRQHDIRGYATSVHTACASGGQALGTALKLIRRGAVDYALAGGFDSMISPVGISGFCLLSALSPDNDTPERASRPFDLTRNGFLLGEGAGFVVLEEWEAARRRGARIYAELAGDGNSLSSYRITDSPPDGDGPIQAMRAALADAGAVPTDVDYLNAHGTSTPMNDRSESVATHTVFGEHVPQAVGELDQEHDGPSHLRRGRGRSGRLRARDSSRRDADQCESGRARPRLRPQPHHRRAEAAARADDAVELIWLRRLEQLRRVAQSGRSRRRRRARPLIDRQDVG